MGSDFLKNILSDIRVEIADEFDRNFSRGAFFGKKWQNRRDGTPSHLITTGKLRRSIRADTQGNGITFTSSEPYAAIHNEGGRITVTAKMKKYFWAKYAQNKHNTGLAETYKRLALMRVGSQITIPRRQYIGDAPEVRKAVDDIVRRNFDEYARQAKQNIINKTKIK